MSARVLCNPVGAAASTSAAPEATHDEALETKPSESASAAARNRAAAEFACAPETVRVTPVLYQTGATSFEVDACGHRVVYTCRAGYNGERYKAPLTRGFCIRDVVERADAGAKP